MLRNRLLPWFTLSALGLGALAGCERASGTPAEAPPAPPVAVVK
ncbi:cytochrome-c peroxidase, partial [Corallococcus llansteffanensis]